MNAPVSIPAPSELTSARLLIESNMDLISACERELGRLQRSDDPTGERGHKLEKRIQSAQGIVARYVAVLTGFSLDELHRRAA